MTLFLNWSENLSLPKYILLITDVSNTAEWVPSAASDLFAQVCLSDYVEKKTTTKKKKKKKKTTTKKQKQKKKNNSNWNSKLHYLWSSLFKYFNLSIYL